MIFKCISGIDEPSLTDNRHHDEHEQLAYDIDDTMQHPSIIHINQFNQNMITMENNLQTSRTITKDIDRSETRNLSLLITARMFRLVLSKFIFFVWILFSISHFIAKSTGIKSLTNNNVVDKTCKNSFSLKESNMIILD